MGINKDTGEFARDSIKQWLYDEGRKYYPQTTTILMLCDSGGSNSHYHNIFKAELQKVVGGLGVEIRVAHYPSYASRWNPIEHGLFCHITRALQGVIFKSYKLVKELIEKAIMKTGLSVKANIMKKVYQTGRKVVDNFKEAIRIVFDEKLGKWNYRAVPLKV